MEEIKKMLIPTPWVLSKESLNEAFSHYLFYTGKDYNYTQVYLFNEKNVCTEYRIVSKMDNVIAFMKFVDDVYIKVSKNLWKSKDGTIQVILELDAVKDSFRFIFYTPEPAKIPIISG